MTGKNRDQPRLSAADMKTELMERIRTEGVEVAFATALEVMRDPKAAAPAKATMTTVVFRAAGYLEKEVGGAEVDLSSMTRKQLESFVAKTARAAAALEDEIAQSRRPAQENCEPLAAGGDETGVFG